MRAARTICTIALLAFAAGVAFPSPANAQMSDVAVVVNSKNSVSSITLADLRKVFSGQKRTWPGGTAITIIVRSSASHERETLLHLLRMSESDYKEYWRLQVYRGDAAAEPIAVPSNGMQREALAIYPGAIALVEAEDVKQGMKILTVDGHLPGTPGYSLR
jgi:ABC-type phosphate transport system substrate-binding protein